MAGVNNGGTTILPNSFGEFIAGPNYNHVTVVQVEESEQKNRFDDDFVTVLQVGEDLAETDNSIEEEIIVYRLPGERLGMALKFEGGLNANEKINKVFIQSINIDSPASKVRGQHLEFLREGDQIMQIDGRSTTAMTRLECIGLLRDAPVCIKIRVRRDSTCQSTHSSNDSPVNSHNQSLNSSPNQSETADNSLSNVNNWQKKVPKVPPPVPKRSQTTILSSKRKSVNNCLTRSDSDCDPIEKPPRKKLSQPPPLPPRRPKVPPPKPPNVKNGETEEQNCQNSQIIKLSEIELNIDAIESNATNSEANDLLVEEVIETKLGHEKQIESENKSSEPTLPSEADVYLDLLADEDRLLIESESDDTGSSVSTIIERFSRTSTANSSFSDHVSRQTPTLDIVGRVLSPFEKLERELDHKEALQAFVSKAAAVLMADEDLRQITEESLGNTEDIEMDIEECVEISSLEFCEQHLVNINAIEMPPNVQIIVPPEEFCNNLTTDSEEFGNNQITDSEEFCNNLTTDSEEFGNNQITDSEEFGNNLTTDSEEFGNNLTTDSEEFGNNLTTDSEEFGNNLTTDSEEFDNNLTTNSEEFKVIGEVCQISTNLSEETEKEAISPHVEPSAPEECFKGFESFDLTLNDDNDSIESEMEFIEKILNEVENEQKSQQLMVFEIEDQIQRHEENTFKPLDATTEMHVVCNEITDTSIKPLIEEQIKCEETKTNEMVLRDETQNDIEMIDESNKTIEEKVDSVVNTLEAIDSIKNSIEVNDNTIDNDLSYDNEKDLFQDIDELNREIEALEELVEYEIKMESLKESQNSKTNEDKENLKFSQIEDVFETVNKSNDELDDKSAERVVERENSVQSQNGNKYSPPMSLIPRRLPSATPRKSKSYGNIPALFAAFKTPDKKPSLIPRPVSKTNINTPINNKNESPIKAIHWQNSAKVQNSKTIQKSKTRILSERKKNEVFSGHSIETKRTVHKPGKSALKCKSLMDLTSAFNSAEVRNGVNDSEESIECIENNRQNECQDIVLIETNRTESSLQSKQTDDTIGGTESESQIDLREDSQQKDNNIDSCLNQHTLITDDNLIDKSDDIPEKEVIETPLITTLPEECVNEIQSEDNAIQKEEQIEENPKVEEKVEEVVEEEELTEEEDMIRMRRSHNSRGAPINSSTCAPPTYARQPPDGREITLNYMDGQSSNGLNPTDPYDIFQTPVHEDSGVFIDTDTPSPELDFNSSSMSRGGPPNVAVTRIKYKSSNGDNSSDGDTGITSMSSDSMDELDSCPLPNYKLKKQIIERSRNPSSDFLSETEMNGLSSNQINNSNKTSDSTKSMRERIAMFDNQTNDGLELKDSIKTMSKSVQSMKNEYSLNNESSALCGKSELISGRLSMNEKSDLIINNQFSDKSNESQNGCVYNTKSTFIHKKSPSLTSDNPQPSPTTPQYSGHLQPSYLRYSSLGSPNDSSLQSNAYSGIGVHKPLINGNLLSSILETRKQNASKLKGLIIPDIPTASQPAVSKTLPTILSNTSTSSLLTTPKPEEMISLTQKSQIQSQPNISSNYISGQRLLSDPPSLPFWANNASIPKYSPAFKRRQLELPRSLSLLNNASQERSDSTDPFVPSFNRSNSMTTMSPNDSQFQFSLSHSKPVIPLMPETAVGSPNIDSLSAKSTPSLEEQLALSVNDSYRHSSVQRRYSADVFNYNNSLKFSLEKRSSADSSINSLYKTQMNSMTQNDIICSQSSDRSPVLNNKLYNSLPYLDNKPKPTIPERKSITDNKLSENDYSIHRNIFSYNSNPNQSLNTNNKNENLFNRSIDKTFTRSLINSDYSDDDSSTISHKTSEDSSVRADDSASDTTSDSMDQSMSPELTRPKVLGTQLTVLKNQIESENVLIKNDNNSDSVKNFRALAEQWEQRSGSENFPQNNKSIPPPLPPKPSANPSRMPPSLMPRTKIVASNELVVPIEPPKPIEPLFCPKTEIRNLENTIKELEIIDEIDSSRVSIDSGSDSGSDSSVKSRSRSVSDICKVFESNGSEISSQIKYNKNTSPLNSIKSLIPDNKTICDVQESQEVQEIDEKEEISEKEEPLETNEEIETETETANNSLINSEEKAESWEKHTEKEEPVLTNHQRMSSIDSLASDSGASSSGNTAVRSLGMRTSSASNLRDSQYGSVSSLASSTSLISPQELQQLIEEANQSLETTDINNHNIQVVVLHREYKTSGSIGITLAGGSDCETKEITVHRVINGSITDRDGRIKRGDRILSINGKILKGVSHKEALDIMKAPRPEVVIVLSRINFSENGFHSRQSSSDLTDTTHHTNSNSYHTSSEDIISSQLSSNRESENLDSNYKILRAELQKDVTGLGFILEGGKDSPLGDRPLAIKRIFRGGPADKEGTLASGDEVITVNEHSVNNMTRTEAWSFLKKLPEGPVVLVVKRKKY